MIIGLAGTAAADTQTFAVDPGHSSITFSVKHMVISTVRGSFGEVSGTVQYDADNVENSSVEVSVEAASIDTKNERRDDDLRGGDFLNVAEHPAITFKSKSIKKTADGFIATGDLRLRGVTKTIEVPFVLSGPIQNPWGQTVIGAEGAFEINRKEYGLMYNQMIESGGLVVSDEVKIQVALEAKK